VTARITVSGLGLAALALAAVGGVVAATGDDRPAPAATYAPAWPPFDGLGCAGLVAAVDHAGLGAWTYAARTAEEALAGYLDGLRSRNDLRYLRYERYDGGPNRTVFVGFRPDGSEAAAIPFVTGGERWLRAGLSAC
jgi:hypothetical protein